MIGKTWVAAFVAAMAMGVCPSQAATLFSDDFESETTPPITPGYIADYAGFAKWDVVGVGVDLVGPLATPSWATFVDSIVVDLDGVQGSTLVTKQEFQLLPGNGYTLTFDLGGPLGGTFHDTVVVELGSAFNESITFEGRPLFETFTRTITVASPTTGRLSFTDLGADSNGALLDNVRLQSNSVPEPTSLVLWSGLGIMGLIAGRHRRRQFA